MACSNSALSHLSSQGYTEQVVRYNTAWHSTRPRTRLISQRRLHECNDTSLDSEFKTFTNGDTSDEEDQEYSSIWNPDTFIWKKPVRKRHYEPATPNSKAAIPFQNATNFMYDIMHYSNEENDYVDFVKEYLTRDSEVDISSTHWLWGKLKNDRYDKDEKENVNLNEEDLYRKWCDTAQSRLGILARHFNKDERTTERSLDYEWSMHTDFQESLS